MLGVGVALVSVALAGCLSGGATPTTTVVTTTTVAVTTTTTTLPNSVGVGGTTPSGAMSFLGQIKRVPVVEPILGSALLPPAPTTPGTVLPSIQIAYRQFGSGSNLLLVMGQRGTMTWWDPQFLAALSSKYSVTIFDLPGVGYSQPAPTPPTLSTYADETAGLIVALGLAKTSLRVLGWGLGGDVALEADIRHPGLMTALSLVDAPALGAANVRASRPRRWRSPRRSIRRCGSPSCSSPPTKAWLARLAPADRTARTRRRDRRRGDRGGSRRRQRWPRRRTRRASCRRSRFPYR